MARSGARSFRVANNSDPPIGSLVRRARAKRVTLAIFFTDIVGSTPTGRELGDEAMNRVWDEQFAQSRKLIADHAGRWIKGLGDGDLAVFKSVEAALDYALALQADPGPSVLRLRAGIHIGPVYVVGKDIRGEAVNFAARVAGANKGAEIWLSNQAVEDLRTLKAERHKELRWREHPVELKGFGAYTLWSLAPVEPHRSLAEIVVGDGCSKEYVPPSPALPVALPDLEITRTKLILYELRLMPPRHPSQEYLGRIRELLEAASDLDKENRASLFDDLDRLETAVVANEHRDVEAELERSFYRNLFHALRGPIRQARQELEALPDRWWCVVYNYYREICDDPRQWLVCVALNKLFVTRKDQNAIPLLQEMIERDPDPNNNFVADCMEAGRRILGRRNFDGVLNRLFGHDFVSRWDHHRRAVDPRSDPEPERDIPTAIPRSRPQPVAKSYPADGIGISKPHSKEL
jgi:class 3 adenylate cyclase